jgi:hypothetical protein
MSVGGLALARSSVSFRGGVGLAAAVAVTLASTAFAEGETDPFRSWISPVSNPTNFEDPRATAEVRPIFAYHLLDDDFITGGGEAYVGAVQARVALGDRLGIIATKDGYIWIDPDEAVPATNGWLNIAFGAKYAVWLDPETETIATLGLRYEAPTGNDEVYQARPDGVLNPFLSAGWGIGDLHLLAYTGARLPISGDDSSFFDLSAHADYEIGMFYPLLELNWVHVLDGGRRLPINQEGFDIINFGSRYAGGSDVLTLAAGARIRPWDHIEWLGGRIGSVDFGAVYEYSLLGNDDLFGGRLTTDVVIRFW